MNTLETLRRGRARLDKQWAAGRLVRAGVVDPVIRMCALGCLLPDNIVRDYALGRAAARSDAFEYLSECDAVEALAFAAWQLWPEDVQMRYGPVAPGSGMSHETMQNVILDVNDSGYGRWDGGGRDAVIKMFDCAIANVEARERVSIKEAELATAGD